jgi:hypothetical protein
MYHDFGLAGLVVGALLLGSAAVVLRNLLVRFPNSILLLGAGSATIGVLLLSPIHPAVDFLAFPFICFSFVLIAAITGIWRAIGRRSEAGAS